jgi:prevent-host-death family protein
LPDPRPLVAAAHEIERQFAHYSDVSLTRPVVVTKNGRPRNVLLSIDEYNRLKARDQLAFKAEDTPEHFLAEIETIASGERR